MVYVYIDQRTRRITATARLDRHLDKTPARYRVGDAVDLLIVEPTDLGYKAIINGQHWGLIHKNRCSSSCAAACVSEVTSASCAPAARSA